MKASSWALALWAAFTLGCGKSELTGQTTGPAGATVTNAQVFDRLSPSCNGCHSSGSSTPFFSSLTAFENLLVYQPRYVTPGSAGGSTLIRLLEGNGTEPLRQMPMVGDSYAVRAQRGEGRISLAELRLWITRLTPRQNPPLDASRDAPLVRRKSAEQLAATLKSQLGLTDTDFFTTGYRDTNADLYPARSPDAAPITPPVAQTNYIALGGPAWLKSKRANLDPSLVFAQQLVPMSQAWCRMAVAKPGNPILVDATLSDSSSDVDGANRIQRNIARLHLRMLGEPSSAAETGDLFDLFKAYESAGPDVAWTAVCAGLVRNPLWVTF